MSEQNSEKEWHHFKWGTIGVTSCMMAYAMIFFVVLFNGTLPEWYLVEAVIVFLFTILSWYNAFVGMPRFYKVVFSLLATWMLIGLAFGYIYVLKVLSPGGERDIMKP